MKYESIDANATDDNKVINLANCGDCNYTGNKGMWKGTIWMGGEVQSLEGMVKLGSDNTWILDDIIPPGVNKVIHGQVVGEAECPICGSLNFY